MPKEPSKQRCRGSGRGCPGRLDPPRPAGSFWCQSGGLSQGSSAHVYHVHGERCSRQFRVQGLQKGFGFRGYLVVGFALGFWVQGLLGARFRAHVLRSG